MPTSHISPQNESKINFIYNYCKFNKLTISLALKYRFFKNWHISCIQLNAILKTKNKNKKIRRENGKEIATIR